MHVEESLMRELMAGANGEPAPLDAVAELVPEAAGWRPLAELLPKEEYGPPLAGTVHAQWVTCGKPCCKCATGELHGPYWYRFAREGGRLHKHYIPRAELDAVRTRCAEHHALGYAKREANRRINLKAAAAHRLFKDVLRYWGKA